MRNPQAYMNHPLNTSVSKQTYSFAKSKRFKQPKLMNDVIYQLPTTNMYRSCSFGYGSKIGFVEKEKSPPPGTYEFRGEFRKSSNYNTISFHIGRNMVKFGSFYRSENGPSPNAYRIKTEYLNDRRTTTMAPKLPTEFDMVTLNKTPGPGNYELDATQMKGSKSYILSHYHNHISPKYLSPSKKSRSRSPDSHSMTIGPGQYDFTNQKFGKSLLSKFKNSITSSFSKEQRPQINDKTKQGYPGFKYKRFSEFRGTEY